MSEPPSPSRRRWFRRTRGPLLVTAFLFHTAAHYLLPVQTSTVTMFALLLLFVALPTPSAAQECQATPFACAVDQSIELGLQNLRNRERGTGEFSEDLPNHNALGILAFLERRSGVGWLGPAQGYDGLDVADQEMVLRLVNRMLESEPSMANRDAVPRVYEAGGNLMALSAYLASGGPDDVGAAVTATQAIANGAFALSREQGVQPPNNDGGWNYGEPLEIGDLSVTHFAISASSRRRISSRARPSSCRAP